MLRDDFVLKVPASLPYGGAYTGPREIDEFLARIDDGPYWESFVTDIDHVIVSDHHLIAPITITARGKTSGASMTIENLAVRGGRRQLHPGSDLRRHRRRRNTAG